MTRVEYSYDEIRELARTIGLDPDKLPTLTALCEHGRQSDDFCRSCEAGYTQDGHYYVDSSRAIAQYGKSAGYGTSYAVGVFDDGTFCVYIPGRYQARVNRAA
jgi:hypothetical protein